MLKKGDEVRDVPWNFSRSFMLSLHVQDVKENERKLFGILKSYYSCPIWSRIFFLLTIPLCLEPLFCFISCGFQAQRWKSFLGSWIPLLSWSVNALCFHPFKVFILPATASIYSGSRIQHGINCGACLPGPHITLTRKRGFLVRVQVFGATWG